MRTLFTLLLVLWMGTCFANEAPVFEEADEEEIAASSFLAESLIFEDNNDQFSASYVRWPRYKADFGVEKIFIRFPQKPVVTQSSTLLTAYAYDHLLLYSFSGYYPPIGNINPKVWIDEALSSVSIHPFTCLNHLVYQNKNGDFILDYVAHDYVKNTIIKARAIITPFNAFTMQCTKPNGARDQFHYFIESFVLKCENVD